jgi:hypothetical protein
VSGVEEPCFAVYIGPDGPWPITSAFGNLARLGRLRDPVDSFGYP